MNTENPKPDVVQLTATPGKEVEVWECANCGEWCQVFGPGEDYHPMWDGPLISGYGAGGVICFHIDSEDFQCNPRAVERFEAPTGKETDD